MESVVVFSFFCFRFVNYEINIKLFFLIKKQHDAAFFVSGVLSCFKMSIRFKRINTLKSSPFLPIDTLAHA